MNQKRRHRGQRVEKRPIKRWNRLKLARHVGTAGRPQKADDTYFDQQAPPPGSKARASWQQGGIGNGMLAPSREI
jgi:hypothetical protein